MLTPVADAPEFHEEAWPEFIFHDALAKQYAKRRDRFFANWNFYFVTEPGNTRYPLTDIATYQTWTREDGLPLDPWLRTHVRLGAKILAPAPASQTITGTVAEWEKWTGMPFPSPGTYTIPAGPSTLTITDNIGTYTEPNIWVRHA